MIDDDDLPVGRVLTRREALALLAVTGAGLVVGCDTRRGSAGATAGATAAGDVAAASGATTAALPACVVRPELTVGPYFVDQQLQRSDLRTEPSTGQMTPGAPLALAITVSQVANRACTPLPGAMVDLWQCDAGGQYSGVNDRMVGFDTLGQKFLRGYQVTDANGVAHFTTIYPGWYQGRTVHIHFKVRAPMAGKTEAYEFTSQLFFDDALTDRVHARPPYAARGKRDLRNADDGIFNEAGQTLVLALAPQGDGYAGRFDLALDLSDAAVGAADRMRGGGPAGGFGPPPRGGRPPGPPPGAPPRRPPG